MKRSLFSIVVLLLIASLVLAACGATPTDEPTTAPEPTQAPAATEPSEPSQPTTEVDFAMMPGGYLERAVAGEFAGTEVTVDGPFTNPDDIRFAESMAAFEEATGITVNYIGDKQFEARITISVDAGDAPDIAD
ncbi:MAG: carbohydrate ABC transporter substrate-binding protein, partial [Anaerolineae bacterium]